MNYAIGNPQRRGSCIRTPSGQRNTGFLMSGPDVIYLRKCHDRSNKRNNIHGFVKYLALMVMRVSMRFFKPNMIKALRHTFMVMEEEKRVKRENFYVLAERARFELANP